MCRCTGHICLKWHLVRIVVLMWPRLWRLLATSRLLIFSNNLSGRNCWLSINVDALENNVLKCHSWKTDIHVHENRKLLFFLLKYKMNNIFKMTGYFRQLKIQCINLTEQAIKSINLSLGAIWRKVYLLLTRRVIKR